MNFKAILIAAILLPVLSQAGEPNWTCQNKNVRIIEARTELGEAANGTEQRLFSITEKTGGKFGARTAYFLDVRDGLIETDAKTGEYIGQDTVGTNDQKGDFHLVIMNAKKKGAGRTAEGYLSYHHGPMQANRQAVGCTQK